MGVSYSHSSADLRPHSSAKADKRGYFHLRYTSNQKTGLFAIFPVQLPPTHKASEDRSADKPPHCLHSYSGQDGDGDV